MYYKNILRLSAGFLCNGSPKYFRPRLYNRLNFRPHEYEESHWEEFNKNYI